VSEEKVGLAGEVVDASGLGRQDLARRQRTLVGLEVPLRVRQVQVVVPDKVRGRVLVRIQVEVRVLREEDG
jgi:hypothetical protein